ncbi:MAG: tRNA uridine-5-carboxymethylaminomethyl(34) synthesis enzyme MnmG, partial [Steroidobacteraceae bacterium]
LLELLELLEPHEQESPEADRAAPLDERLPAQVQRDLEVRASYAGYIERAMDEIERAQGQQDTPLPAELDYATLGGLSNEVRQKLMQIRPATIGQAARVPGVTPAAVSILLVHLRRRGARVA